MTMRLDIVTNDAGEGVRREHARELGAGVVIAIYRLTKLAQMHDLTNQAFTRQLEQTHQIIGDYCLRSGSNVNVMFADKAVFVAGQLLKGSRSTYEAASELGALFERLGGSELSIQRDLTREELLAFAEQISISYRAGAGTFRSPTPKIRLRAVADAARLRGLELENLSADQRIVRMYASAVVIMRRFFEDLQASRYILPRRIKRIAQSLVDLSDGSTPAFLGVTEVRNANFDEAGRAVNTAILAVSMAREVTQDRAILSQIAMAGMMHDVARPRAMALSQAAGPAMPGMAGPTTLSEDQEDRLAAGAAAVLTALGRVNEPSITRTVLTFEALWLRRQQWLGPVYWGARAPTLHAKLIAIARRYNDLLTPEPGLLPPTPDYAVAALSEELKDPQDRTVLRMLVSALGLLPMGTVVQLATGEVAEVVRGPKGPGEKPRVRLVMDQNGQQLQPVEIELAQDPHRQVVRVMSVDGWRKGLDLRQGVEGEAYGDERDSQPPPELEPVQQ
ncbi:MAG: Translation initiation factor 2, partial [Myxococcaceae bacterium]|nr:Translation initiation factor 2 [Myxococcaceae bacterium]